MDPTSWLIAADITAVLVVVYVLDRNVFHALDLGLSCLPSVIRGACLRTQLQARLWLDRQALTHRSPVGRLWNKYSLWQIRRNPAYREFFQDRSE
jgi:hypothetical protein